MAKCSGGLLVSAIQRMLKRRHPKARVRKLADRMTRGYPDLQIFFLGAPCMGRPTLCVVEVECKAGAGRLSALQEAERDKMKALLSGRVCNWSNGYRWVTARCVEDVMTAMDLMGYR